MEDLKDAMRLIDSNSKSIPEGDYLKICKKLKDAYDDIEETKNSSSEHPYFGFDGRVFPETVDLGDINLSDAALIHLDNSFGRDMCLMEMQMKQAEIRVIKKLIKKNHEVHRITERWRNEAVFIFCKIHGITLETYTPYEYTMRITNAPPVNDMISDYISAINAYRLHVRNDLQNRCTGLEQDVSWITGEFSQIEMDLFHTLMD